MNFVISLIIYRQLPRRLEKENLGTTYGGLGETFEGYFTDISGNSNPCFFKLFVSPCKISEPYNNPFWDDSKDVVWISKCKCANFPHNCQLVYNQ